MSEETENVEEVDEVATPDEAAGADSEANASAESETTRAATSGDATPPSPSEVVPPKERKRRAKARKAAKAPAGVARTAEERHTDRVEERRRKAALRRAGRLKAREKARAGEHQAAVTPPREHEPGTQKTRQGVVVSDGADKTITVRIDLRRRHRRYQKIVGTSGTLHAHDERNDAHVGDTVLVRECRPLSRTKRWRLVEVLERAK